MVTIVRRLLLGFLVAGVLLTPQKGSAEDAAPLAQAHAHNDYQHARPLLDALDHGFCSIEADVWRVGDELLVAHSALELRPDRTLESAYLKPLAERCAARDGWVYEPGQTVTLLVDFKAQGGQIYAALKPQLEKYHELFEPREFKDPANENDNDKDRTTDAFKPKRAPPIVVVVSGDRPIEMIAADSQRLCGIDGRLLDADSDRPVGLMPLVSDDWTGAFLWQGAGPMPAEEREKLRGFVAAAHAKGRRLRFWGTADNEAIWAELTAAGVDLIGTDDLGRLEHLLRERQQ